MVQTERLLMRKCYSPILGSQITLTFPIKHSQRAEVKRKMMHLIKLLFITGGSPIDKALEKVMKLLGNEFENDSEAHGRRK